MQSVFIYVTGSCNAQTRVGSAIVLTEQGSEKRMQTFDYRDTTANRCIIHGLIEGVLQLDAPHHVVLVTSIPIGIVSASKGKGPNHDLVNELLRKLTAKECTYHFEILRGENINKYLIPHSI